MIILLTWWSLSYYNLHDDCEYADDVEWLLIILVISNLLLFEPVTIKPEEDSYGIVISQTLLQPNIQ